MPVPKFPSLLLRFAEQARLLIRPPPPSSCSSLSQKENFPRRCSSSSLISHTCMRKRGQRRGKFPGVRGSERGAAFQGGPSLRGLSNLRIRAYAQSRRSGCRWGAPPRRSGCGNCRQPAPWFRRRWQGQCQSARGGPPPGGR